MELDPECGHHKNKKMIKRNPSTLIRQSKTLGNDLNFTQITTQVDSNAEISSLAVKAIPYDMKAGDKFVVSGNEFTIAADANAGVIIIYINTIVVSQTILVDDWIIISKNNLFVQYQRKTEGQVAGFDIDADGISKGGIEITGWLDSDTMEGATANNVATAESVKAYVDASSGGTTPTLQEVTDAGNTTTNSIIMPSGGTGILGPNNFFLISLYSNRGRITLNSTNSSDASIQITLMTNGSSSMVITKAGNVGIGTTAPQTEFQVTGQSLAWGGTLDAYSLAGVQATDGNYRYSALRFDRTNNVAMFGHYVNSSRIQKGYIAITDAGNVGIGTTSPSEKLEVAGNIKINRTDSNIARLSILTDKSFGRDFYLENNGNSQEIVAENTLKIRTLNNDTKIILEGGSSTDNIQFVTNEAERMRLTDTGLGIGTTSPEEKLHVVGDTFIDGGLKVNAANIDFTGLGTSDPAVTGRLWSDRGVLKISAG